MADMVLIQSAITGLKTAGDIAKSFLELKSISDVQGKVIDLQSAILSAQSSALAAQSEQSTMIQRIRDLEEEVSRVKAWEGQKQRYKLHTPWAGTAVYALKNSMSEGQTPHWICTHCYEDGRRSILQFGHQKESVRGRYICPSCGTMVEVPFRGAPPDIPYAPD